MPDKRLFLLCWDFPPNEGIGGRRWAKLTKYLAKSNFECHILKCNGNIDTKDSQWTKDVQSEKIKIYNIDQHFLSKWLNGTSSQFKRIKFFIANRILSLSFKGSIYDKAIGIEDKIIKYSQEIIDKNKIKYVIVTGAPFNLMYYIAKLLKNNPDIISLADYRDPWITAVNYGMKDLKVSRKEEEEDKQNLVLNQFTYVSSPNTFLLKEIENSYTGQIPFKSKFIEIAHAFDIDDCNGKYFDSQSLLLNSKSTKIVYGGTMYIGIETYIDELSIALKNYQLKFPQKKIEITFYTKDYKKYNAFYDNLKFEPYIGTDFLNVIKGADFLLILLANHNKNYKTTKYYEYIPFNKPYIYLGPIGHVSDSIVNENLGFILNNISEDLEKILNDSERLIKEAERRKQMEMNSFDNRASIISNIFE